jgi:hypothetical protein
VPRGYGTPAEGHRNQKKVDIEVAEGQEVGRWLIETLREK